MIELQVPLTTHAIEELRVGDYVLVSGNILTARDRALSYLAEKTRPEFTSLLDGGVVYHCGPVAKMENGQWSIISAGPTTSERMEAYQADVIRNYNLRCIIGKGGMGSTTLEALKDSGAVYLHALGGAGALAARALTKVHNVHLLEEFGVPEAIWELEVDTFPAIVSMDSNGGSLHTQVKERSEANFRRLARMQ